MKICLALKFNQIHIHLRMLIEVKVRFYFWLLCPLNQLRFDSLANHWMMEGKLSITS